MFSLNSTKACTKVKKMTRKREQSRALKKKKEYQINTIPFQNLQKMRFKMPSTASKKEKQKTAVEYELNSSKIAVKKPKKKSGRSSMKLHDKRTSHRKVGARSESRSSTRKVTEKMQAITGQFAACQYYINCSPQYFMHVSLLPCTKSNLPTKVGFGPIIELMII